jgi:hypothetical protein
MDYRYWFFWNVKHSLKSTLQNYVRGLNDTNMAIMNWLNLVFDDEIMTYRGQNFHKLHKDSHKDFFRYLQGWEHDS